MFELKGITLKEVVDARKEKIASDDAWDTLSTADEIIVGKGKKFQVFVPTEENRDGILKAALGRTGNLRAPALRIGDRMLVGFSEDMYEKYVK